jgi:hypothetical protein
LSISVLNSDFSKNRVFQQSHIKSCLHSVKHTLHALKEEYNDGLTAKQIEDALKEGFELIEDYPDDPRGHSSLLLTWVDVTPMHVVCAPHESDLIIITLYIPSGNEWNDNFKQRK